MAKAISSASEFLAAIASKNHPFEVEGVTIELRPLTYEETVNLQDKYGDKPVLMGLEVAKMCIAKPELDETQLGALGKAVPGIVQKISSEVMRISGMGVDSNGPLDGTGS